MTDEKKYTVFERARLIGARALQISQGAPLKVDLSEQELEGIGYNPVEIAKIELREGKIPLEVRRPQKSVAKK